MFMQKMHQSVLSSFSGKALLSRIMFYGGNRIDGFNVESKPSRASGKEAEMWTKQKRKSIRGRFVLPILTAAFLSYFGFHAYHGEFGLYSRLQLEQQKTLLTEQLERVTDDRAALEKRVTLLRDGSIEKDMLDEQARRALNLSHADEMTIIISKEDQSN